MRHKSQEGQTNDDDDDADKRYQRYQKRTHKTHTHSHCVMSVCFVVNLSQPQTHHLSFGAHTGIRHTLAHALTPITRFDLPVFAIKYRNKCIFGSCLAQFFLLSDFFFFLFVVWLCGCEFSCVLRLSLDDFSWRSTFLCIPFQPMPFVIYIYI